jgi:hypothetical protein
MSNANLFTEDDIRDELQKSPEIQGKQYFEDPRLKKLAKEVIDDKDLEFGPAEIGYMIVYPNVSKKVAGRCKTTSGELEFYTGYQYLIQMSGELWDVLTPQSQYILMWHELLHVKPVYNSNTGKWKFRIRDHDFEDFYEINASHGLDWMRHIKGEVSALYDLSADAESEVKL